MNGFVHDNLNISVEEGSGFVLVDWRGESDARDPNAILKPFLTTLATKLEGKTVRLRFDDLKYMNSASVTPIMQFLKELSKAAESVLVRYDETIQWQATSFRAMRVVARRWTNVEVRGGSAASAQAPGMLFQSSAPPSSSK